MNNIIKKVASTLSLTTLVFSTFSSVYAADVSPETDAANSLSSLGIIVDQSSSPEAYNLGATITRREMLKVMINMALIQVGDTCIGKFADLPASDWGCKYAEVALSRGFIAPNAYFRPDDSVSKAEALKMIFQSRSLSKDYSYEDWRVGYIAEGLKNGVLDTLFTDYNTPGTRGWIFTLGSNAINITPDLPTACVDEAEGTPVITSISTHSGTVDTKLTIKGCNFSGFEGDKNAWIENDQGTKGILYGDATSTSNILHVTLTSPLCQNDTSYSGLPCDAWLTLIPGEYKIYTSPWGKQSNIIDFTILDSSM